MPRRCRLAGPKYYSGAILATCDGHRTESLLCISRNICLVEDHLHELLIVVAYRSLVLITRALGSAWQWNRRPRSSQWALSPLYNGPTAHYLAAPSSRTSCLQNGRRHQFEGAPTLRKVIMKLLCDSVRFPVAPFGPRSYLSILHALQLLTLLQLYLEKDICMLANL